MPSGARKVIWGNASPVCSEPPSRFGSCCLARFSDSVLTPVRVCVVHPSLWPKWTHLCGRHPPTRLMSALANPHK